MTDLEIIWSIEEKLEKKLDKQDEFDIYSRSYTINAKGEVSGLSLFICAISDLGWIAGELKALTGLQNLSLIGNKISDLSPIKDLVQLNSLILESNQISDLSPVKDLLQLKELYLGANQISNLSPIKYLVQLNKLYLDFIQISDLSPIKDLVQLNLLVLDNNQISDLSPIKDLVNLTYLSLRKNKIEQLPAWLADSYLDISMVEEKTDNGYIYLYGNPLKNPPPEIISQGKAALKDYFEEQNRKGSRALNECKLIFIGDGGTGKTSLMRRLVYNQFNEKEETTHGINKIAWNDIKCNNSKPIRINLWDFGGQHIQHSLHQFFFTERVIYVLVLNPRNVEKAAYWLEQVKKLGDGSKVLVVYNWKQDQDKKASYLSNFYELRKKYPEIIGPYLLSCAVKGSEEEFKTALINTIKNHENLNDTYPNTWYEIKKTVEDKVTVGKNYVGYEEYEQWCRDNDYKDAEKQKSLLVILNRIGSIVFFDKPVLDRLQVLNPEWITTGAYAILTSEITAQKQGRLTIKDFKKIFKEPREIFSDKAIKIEYTDSHFEFIIQLMLEYNLICEEKVGKHTEYLVPSCFKEKPDTDYEAHKKDARWYRVQFDAPFEMLIIQRFIARKIANAVGEEYWQSGIFMKDNVGETYALAETNLYSYCIDFWIKGEEVREFWANIRRELHAVLSMYKKLDYKEEVRYEAENKVVFLPYKEMLKTLERGIKVIEYHPTYDISNIDVLEVLDMFQDRSQTEITLNNKRVDRTYDELIKKRKTIKIFLASSSELKDDRKDFELFIGRENKELNKKNIFIELIIWEDFIDALSKTRLQDEYNKEVREADIFVSLFYTKVGKYTKEEFNQAFGQFIKSGNPLVYTYFKTCDVPMNKIKKEDINSKFAFEKLLESFGHYKTEYENIDNLQNKFKSQLDKLISEGRI